MQGGQEVPVIKIVIQNPTIKAHLSEEVDLSVKKEVERQEEKRERVSQMADFLGSPRRPFNIITYSAGRRQAHIDAKRGRQQETAALNINLKNVNKYFLEKKGGFGDNQEQDRMIEEYFSAKANFTTTQRLFGGTGLEGRNTAVHAQSLRKRVVLVKRAEQRKHELQGEANLHQIHGEDSPGSPSTLDPPILETQNMITASITHFLEGYLREGTLLQLARWCTLDERAGLHILQALSLTLLLRCPQTHRLQSCLILLLLKADSPVKYLSFILSIRSIHQSPSFSSLILNVSFFCILECRVSWIIVCQSSLIFFFFSMLSILA